MNKAVLGMLALFLLAGCAASGTSLLSQEQIAVERIDSRSGRIGYVWASRTDTGIRVHGSIRRFPPLRGPIPGHIDLSVVSPGGAIIEQRLVDYRRRSVKAREAQFSFEIVTALPPGTTLRLSHHAGSHG
jgi:hypothetical protein